ncbi:hypothetical protein COTS27_01415 [Spirochaetota bacterium]|nr:hypothetical protein COTS27_01415 [Spirochaetota bacterium]
MKHHHLIMYIAITSLIMLADCTTSSSESFTGDLIELKLLGGTDGDLMNTLTLTEGITPPTAPLVVKNCGVFPPPYRVLVGGADMTAAYTLTATGINPYVSTPQTDTGVLTLTDGTTTLTFSSLRVTTSSCNVGDLLGAGTDANAPYIIDNDRKLSLVAELVNGTDTTYRGSHYRVTRDIDLARPMAPWSEGNGQFTPIGAADSTVFNGTFDCQGNVISNLYINTTGSYKGLFGVVGTTGTITNCGLVNAKVTVDGMAPTYIGSLVGFLNTGGTVAKSYSEDATVIVTGLETEQDARLGGLVGDNSGGTISASYSTGMVMTSGQAAGGLVGVHDSNGTISQSYSEADVTGYQFIGGLVGNSVKANTVIENSYATGSVTAMGSFAVGGLIGFNEAIISNSYASGQIVNRGRGLAGFIGRRVTASYWDTITSGQTDANGDAVGKTTTQMQVAAPVPTGDDAVYVGWSQGIWDFRAREYPRLKSVACATRQYAPATTRTCEDIP